MGKLGQSLALAGALGAFGCDEEVQDTGSQEGIAMQQQGLSVQDLPNLMPDQRLSWSEPGDSSPNYCHIGGSTLIVFGRNSDLGPSYVKCNEISGCVEEGAQAEQILGLPERSPLIGHYGSGFVYTDNLGIDKFRVWTDLAGMVEFNISLNENNQLEVSGEPVVVEPIVSPYSSYFEQNGVPYLYDLGVVTNLWTGESAPPDPNSTLDSDVIECGSPGVDSETGLTLVGTILRDANGRACRLFYGDSMSDSQRSRLTAINNNHPGDNLGNPRSYDNVLIFQSSPRDGSSLSVLNYAIVQPAAPQDAGTPDAAVDAATDAGVDANAGGAGGAGGSGGIQALDAAVGGFGGAGGSGAEGGTGGSGGIQALDAGMAGAGGTGGIQSPDAAVGGSGGSGGAGAEGGTGGSGGIQTPDAGAAGSGGTGGIQSPDAGMAGSGGTGGIQTPDAGMGGSPSPDSGLGGTPGPDARPPAELAPFDVTLLTGNCIERVLGNVVIAGIHYTKEEIEGDGTQICEVEIATADGEKIPAKLTIRNDRQRTMRVTILLPFDSNANPISETTTPRTGSRPKEEQHGGVHINNQNLGIVTSSAASEFETMMLDESEDGRIKFLVASFNKPEEPQVFEIFPDGSRLAVNSDGKTYEVNIETREITETKLREIPTCVENDPTCEIETGGSSGEGGAGGSDVPGENGGKSGCDCSIGGRTLPQAEFYALLMALGLAYRRREKSKN